MAIGIVAVTIASSVLGIVQMNRVAYATRLRTTALALAQERIDDILSTPWQSGARPAILSTATETNLPMNNDPTATASDVKSPFSDLDLQVNASRTTVITDLKPPTGTTTRQVTATVTVTYKYRSRDYSISLTTLRTIDSI